MPSFGKDLNVDMVCCDVACFETWQNIRTFQPAPGFRKQNMV